MSIFNEKDLTNLIKFMKIKHFTFFLKAYYYFLGNFYIKFFIIIY